MILNFFLLSILFVLMNAMSSINHFAGENIWIWGDNYLFWNGGYYGGKLGRNDVTLQRSADKLHIHEILNDHKLYKRICHTFLATFVLTIDNKIYAWGGNRDPDYPYTYVGNLGPNGRMINSTFEPVLILDDSSSVNENSESVMIKEMYCGNMNVMILKNDGKLYGMGHNENDVLNQGVGGTVDEFISVMNGEIENEKILKVFMIDAGNYGMWTTCGDVVYYYTEKKEIFKAYPPSCPFPSSQTELLEITGPIIWPDNSTSVDDFFGSNHVSFALIGDDIYGHGIEILFGDGDGDYSISDCYAGHSTRLIDFFNEDSGIVHLKGRKILDLQCDNNAYFCPDYHAEDGHVCFVLFDDYWVYSWGWVHQGFGSDTKTRHLGRNYTNVLNMARPFPIDHGEIPESTKIIMIFVSSLHTYYLSETGDLYGTGRSYGSDYAFESSSNPLFPMRIAPSIKGITWIGGNYGYSVNTFLTMHYNCDGIIPTSPTACGGEKDMLCTSTDKCTNVHGEIDVTLILILSFIPVIIILVIFFVAAFLSACWCYIKYARKADIDNADLALRKMEKKEESRILKDIYLDKDIFSIKYGNLKILRCIGNSTSGLNSVVYHCVYKKKEVAFKCFKCFSDAFVDQNEFDNFTKHVKTYMQIKHENISHIIGCTMRPKMGLVSELGTLGNFKDVLQNGIIPLNVNEKVKLFLEISRGMEYLSEQRMVLGRDVKLIHGSLKLENIILSEIVQDDTTTTTSTSSGKIKWVAKISDAGYVKFIENFPKDPQNAIYNAPELLKGERRSEKSDVWAFAICVFQAFTKNFKPYGDVPLKRIEFKVLDDETFRPDISTLDPPFVSQLILKATSANPENRPTFKEIRQLFEENYVEEKEVVMEGKVEEKKEDESKVKEEEEN